MSEKTLLPFFNPAEVRDAFSAYGEMQKTIESLMAGQVQTIGKGDSAKAFHKMGFWRAMAMAYGLTLDLVSEKVYQTDNGIACEATYRVTSPDGRATTADGSCDSIEKQIILKDWKGWEKRGKPAGGPVVYDAEGLPAIDKAQTMENATLHNIRGHAHTRAKNRAISEFLAFGEESGDEPKPATQDDRRQGKKTTPKPATQDDRRQGKKTTPKQEAPKQTKAQAEFEGVMNKWVKKLGKKKWEFAYGLVWKWGKEQSGDYLLPGIEAACGAIEQKVSSKVLRAAISGVESGNIKAIKEAMVAVANKAATSDEKEPAKKGPEATLPMTLAAITERALADGIPEAVLQEWRLELGISIQDEKTQTKNNMADLQKKVMHYQRS